jgi:hypothetical protein
MIGVIAKPGQAGLVEEFFELFKTPWEPFEAGRPYDVIITTTGEVPHGSAISLLVVCGADAPAADRQLGIATAGRQRGGVVRDGENVLPIYRDLQTFAAHPDGGPFLAAERGCAGLRFERDRAVVIRIGYDLFDEAAELLTTGQPLEHAHVPTLDLHIEMLRRWILAAGIDVVEVPPVPAGHPFMACLTHDIDYVGIRRHFLDRTMWGFVARATIGALHGAMRGRLTIRKLLLCWRAVAMLPLVYLGWAEDFWEPFAWYARVEHGLPATYFLIPYKRRAGDKVTAAHAERRATRYDVADISGQIAGLLARGCEVGVHGIDAWHDATKGRDELEVVSRAANRTIGGIRMHWLLNDGRTASVLEAAGYRYDSTAGYNETVGYRNGTGQVFCPPAARSLLELPLHIQDGALFYGGRLNLSERQAGDRCAPMVEGAHRRGGVLTLLWHDRSHGPERFWGDFYVGLIAELKAANAWFGSADDVTAWFRWRRRLRFERPGTGSTVRVVADAADGDPRFPRLIIRRYRGRRSTGVADAPFDFTDAPWLGAAIDITAEPLRPELV